MAKRGDPKVLRLLVIFLRSYAGMTQTQFGKASRVDQADVSRFEAGHSAPSDDVLHRMADVAGIDWFLVVHLRNFYTVLLATIARRGAGLSATALDLTVLETVLLAITPYLIETHGMEPSLPSPDEELREAEQIWSALEAHPIHFRRRLIELSPRSGDWALAVRACEASLRRAAQSPAEALELADLALSIARRFSGDESWRSRLEGYCWAHVGNACWVAQDLTGAEEAFTLAQRLWWTGVESAPQTAGDPVMPSQEGPLFGPTQSRPSEILTLLKNALRDLRNPS